MIRIFLGNIFFTFFVVALAEAAEITISNAANCSINLSGPVAEGDAEKLSTLADRLGLSRERLDMMPDNSNQAICLDSPGGSYLESRKLMAFINERGLATRISSEAECYSACALVFMAGRLRWYEGEGPARYLHVKGLLGFHAPYFQGEESRSYTADELLVTSVTSAAIISDLIRFGMVQSIFESRPSISMSLIGELLATGPNELMMVDTVEDVARWGISIEGNSARSLPSKNALVQACINFQSWSLDLASKPVTYEYYTEERAGVLHGRNRKFLYVDTGGMAARYCLVEIPNEPSDGLSICSYDGFSGIGFGRCDEGWASWMPWWHSLPPNLSISRL